MNKLNAHTPSFPNLRPVEADSPSQTASLERACRLIVLIPPDSEATQVTRRLCDLAAETNSDIQLVGVCRDADQELTLRRELATVAALIRDANVYVEMKVEVGVNWLDAVKDNYQHGDLIVCLEDPSIGVWRKPLSQLLDSTFKAPVYILSKTKSPQSQSDVFSQVISWSGFLGIIVGFFVLQAKITQLPSDWFQTLLLVLVLIPELGLILLWNSLFS